MNGQKHIINREILELTVPDRERALPFQNKASEIVKYRLNPALDELFSKISNHDEVVSIDRLVIDVGAIKAEEMDEDFIRLAIKKAEDELKRILFETRSGSKSTEASFEKDTSGKASVKSLKAGYLDQFVHFLKTGNLSWWKTGGTEGQLNHIVTEVLSLEKSKVQQQILPLLKIPDFRKRFVFQLKDQQLLQFFSLLNTAISGQQLDFIEGITHMFIQKKFLSKNKVFSEKLKSDFWRSTFRLLSVNDTLSTDKQKLAFLKSVFIKSLTGLPANMQKTALETFFEELLPIALKSPENPAKFFIVAALSSSHDFGVKTGKIIESPDFLKLEKQPEFRKLLQEISKSKEHAGTGLKETKKEIKEEVGEEPSPAIMHSENQETENLTSGLRSMEEEEIVISNAGLVILYPFLRPFFEGLGLLNKDLQFKSEEHAIKAVHLLQFLVTKSKINPEYELSLNKILCGLEIQTPVPQGVEFTKTESEECENLMGVVLQRWEALKTKNTDALRDTFLNRDGKLTFQNRGWNLKIERNSFDILLDKLPWGISFIKLPWSSKILHVEW